MNNKVAENIKKKQLQFLIHSTEEIKSKTVG